jgi:hypothetical protein
MHVSMITMMMHDVADPGFGKLETHGERKIRDSTQMIIVAR